MGELTVINDFAAKVREKVKRDFAGMIPDDAWDKLVQDAVTSFIKDDLKNVVVGELTTEIKKRLQEFFHGSEWTEQWNANGTKTASDKVKEIVRENVPGIVEAAIGMTMQALVNDLRYRMSSHM